MFAGNVPCAAVALSMARKIQSSEPHMVLVHGTLISMMRPEAESIISQMPPFKQVINTDWNCVNVYIEVESRSLRASRTSHTIAWAIDTAGPIEGKCSGTRNIIPLGIS